MRDIPEVPKRERKVLQYLERKGAAQWHDWPFPLHPTFKQIYEFPLGGSCKVLYIPAGPPGAAYGVRFFALRFDDGFEFNLYDSFVFPKESTT